MQDGDGTSDKGNIFSLILRSEIGPTQKSVPRPDLIFPPTLWRILNPQAAVGTFLGLAFPSAHALSDSFMGVDVTEQILKRSANSLSGSKELVHRNRLQTVLDGCNGAINSVPLIASEVRFAVACCEAS